MMRPALALPLLLALAACARRAQPPRALPPPPPSADASSVATADASSPDTAEATPLRDLVSLDLTDFSGGCAVHRDGDVWCWGDSAQLWAPVGPVGYDDSACASVVRLPGLTGATAACLLPEAVCVLRSDRSVLCRVLTSRDHPETGETIARVIEVGLPALRDIVALVRTEAGCVAMDSAGRALQLQLQPELVATPRAQPPRRCTLGADETRCVGPNTAGLLANETTEVFTEQSPARLFGLRGLRDVAWAGNHACAALGDGAVRCWGRNLHAQLGLPDLRSRALPTAVPGLDDVVSLAAIDGATCAVRADGTVWCWGTNNGGVFGPEGGTTQPQPRRVAGVEGVASLHLRNSVACARRHDGSVWCWGTSAPHNPAIPPRQPRPLVRPPAPSPAAQPVSTDAG